MFNLLHNVSTLHSLLWPWFITLNSKFVLPHLKMTLFDCHCSWAVVLSFDFENGENRFVGLMQPRSQAFVFLATSSMQIQRRRTHHLQWGHAYGRKKKRKKHEGQHWPINSNFALHWHCLATAPAPSPWTDIQKHWRFFPGHYLLCAFFCLSDITLLTVSATGSNQILMVADGWEWTRDVQFRHISTEGLQSHS